MKLPKGYTKADSKIKTRQRSRNKRLKNKKTVPGKKK